MCSKQFSFIFLPSDILPPLSAYAVLAPLILIEVLGIVRKWGRLDHWAHLGGYLAGMVGAVVVKHKARERNRVERERRKKERGWVERMFGGK